MKRVQPYWLFVLDIHIYFQWELRRGISKDRANTIATYIWPHFGEDIKDLYRSEAKLQRGKRPMAPILIKDIPNIKEKVLDAEHRADRNHQAFLKHFNFIRNIKIVF